MSQTRAGEEVMPLIQQSPLENVDNRSSNSKEFGGGAGVLKWL